MTSGRRTSRWRTGRLLGGILGVALLGLVLVLLRSGGERGGPASARPERAPLVAHADAESARPENAPTIDSTSGMEPSRVPEAERAPVASDPAPPVEPGPACEVLVVYAGTSTAAAGASVWIRVWKEALDPLALDAFDSEPTPYVTDAAGRVRVPVLGATMLVAARLGASFGAGPIATADEDTGPDSGADTGRATPPRIELYPDWDVTVEVRHADGSTARDVPVSLVVGAGPYRAGHQKETDLEGRARFVHVGMKMALEGKREGDVRVRRALDAPLARRLEAEHPPTEPLVLVLPACAPVQVRVLGPEGAPVGDGTQVTLAHLPPGTERDLSPFAQGARESLEESTSAGVATFDCVELGGELELVVLGSGSGPLLRAFRPAPLVAGVREEHVLRIGLDHPVLQFRVLDPGGALLANEELKLALAEHSGWIRTEDEPEARTDSEGRFRLDLVGVLAEGGTRELTVEARQGSIGTRLDLSRPFEPGVQSMGDLRLEPAPLLVAGRVLEGEGTGVAGADVQVHVAVRDEDDATIWYWEELDRPLTSAADGTFELRGFLAESELRLQASAEGRRSETVPAQKGARGLELRMQRAGWIQGKVLIDEGFPLDGFTLELSPSGSARVAPDRRRAGLTPEGRFLFEDLVPGNYDLALGLRGIDDLVRLEGLVVSSGGPALDPRLTIDLRGELSWMRIVLVSEAPVERLTGNLRYGSPEESEQRWTYHWFDHAPVDVLSPLASFDAALTVPGFRTVRLRGVTGAREVRLEPALSARLRLPPGVRLPDPPLFVKAALSPEGEGSTMDWGGSAFDERREIPCRAPQPGRLRVRWILERRGNGGASATTLDGLPEQFVELTEGAAEPVFELEVEDAALQKAIAESGV